MCIMMLWCKGLKYSFLYPSLVYIYSSLRELNLEGNQLGALPVGALHLNLKYVRIQNNFTHPLMWRETAKNQPQVRREVHKASFEMKGKAKWISLQKYWGKPGRKGCLTCIEGRCFFFVPGLLSFTIFPYLTGVISVELKRARSASHA